jgi:DNA polymerase III epsilon subunit-like protein
MSVTYDYVCIDIETTGLSHKTDEIIEVCAIRFNILGQIDNVNKINMRCLPKFGGISEGAQKVHGITMADLVGCPNYLEDGIYKKLAEFIGDRTVIGHNVIAFDSKFLKIIPTKMEDTLLMSRRRWVGGRNNLGAVCSKLGIPYDQNLAHAAEYDVLRTIDVFVKMKKLDQTSDSTSSGKFYDIIKDANIIHAITEEDMTPSISDGMTLVRVGPDGEEVMATGAEVDVIERILCSTVLDVNYQDECKIIHKEIPSDLTERKMWSERIMATQTYSYSRISKFLKCPFSWYQSYIVGFKEEQQVHFITGRVCHLVAEYSAKWVSRENFAMRFSFWARKTGFSVDQGSSLCAAVMARFKITYEDIDYLGIGRWLHEEFRAIKHMDPNPFPSWNTLSECLRDMKDSCDETFQPCSMPPIEQVMIFLNRALVKEKCTDPSVIKDCEHIVWKFFRNKDFSSGIGDVVLPERRFAFDKDWNVLADFYSNKAFYRGIIDLIEFYDNKIEVTDYKTNRKLETLSDMKNDIQIKLYIMATYLLTGKSNVPIIGKKDFMRHGVSLKYDCESPEQLASDAQKWVENSVALIEAELVKEPSEAFRPTRNEHCHACSLNAALVCPLFNKLKNNDIEDVQNYSVSDVYSTKQAWKRIEANNAENSLLTKQIKKYLEASDETVMIDETAELSYYSSISKEIDVEKLLVYLGRQKEKGVEMDRGFLFRNLTLSKTGYEKFCAKHKLKISPEDEAGFTTLKVKNTLNAFTEKEAEDKDMIGFKKASKCEKKEES